MQFPVSGCVLDTLQGPFQSVLRVSEPVSMRPLQALGEPALKQFVRKHLCSRLSNMSPQWTRHPNTWSSRRLNVELSNLDLVAGSCLHLQVTCS